MSKVAGARHWLAGGGLIGAFWLSGCQSLHVTDLPNDAVVATPVATTRAAAPVPYDLAVSAIDVEKPTGRISSEPLVLLAVVENKGTETASNLQVEARLYDGTGKELLLKKSESIDRIAAGESKVVRFRAGEEIPLRDGYIVRVEAVPLSGEVNLSNNTRVLRAEIQYFASRR